MRWPFSRTQTPVPAPPLETDVKEATRRLALPPRIVFNECVACGAIFPPSRGRVLCWKHAKMWQGSVPAVVIANDVTEKLPGT
jgi:hypothetical protein